VIEYSPAKTGEYLRIFPNFQNCARSEKYLKNNKHNSLLLGRKYARIFVLGHYLFLEAHSFPRATLLENCSLLGTVAYIWLWKYARKFVLGHYLFLVGNCIQWVVGSDSKYTNYLMNQPRNPEHTTNGESQWLKMIKKNATKTKICKITTAKFKCTLEHILGHDLRIKITWNYARGQKLAIRREGWVQSL